MKVMPAKICIAPHNRPRKQQNSFPALSKDNHEFQARKFECQMSEKKIHENERGKNMIGEMTPVQQQDDRPISSPKWTKLLGRSRGG